MVRENEPMGSQQILVTGEYWHEDFSGLISSSSALITLCPVEKIQQMTGAENFDLIVVAQGRREVIDSETVEHLQSVFATTPLVALLGTWCEGEVRSGTPWPGIPRVYWHQWEGRFEQFLQCLDADEIHSWQLPATATAADRIAAPGPHFGDENFEGIVAVSAWTKTQYAMIEDALTAFGAQCSWVERATWDGTAKSLVKAVVLDDDSMTSDLETRVKWVLSTFGQVPLVLTLGFPRKDEIEALKELGVKAVVSKPFKLGDLKQALMLATNSTKVSQ
jgi:CheY-like chemotaxis protein